MELALYCSHAYLGFESTVGAENFRSTLLQHRRGKEVALTPKVGCRFAFAPKPIQDKWKEGHFYSSPHDTAECAAIPFPLHIVP